MGKDVEVVVVGGGMVGALCALGFARQGHAVVLVESRRPAEFQPHAAYDLRVSAISPASRNIFSSMGVWDAMCAMRVCPFRRMAVWDGGTTAETRFNAAEIGESELGFIVENRVIQLALWESLQQSDQVDVRCPAVVTDLSTEGLRTEVKLDSGETIRCRLAVAADGARSTVRELASIATTGESYNQHALVASVRTMSGQQDITWQCFAASGPQAFLPLSGNRASLVWYHQPQQVAELAALPKNELLQQIEEHFPARLGGLRGVEAVGSFPISWSHAERYVAPGLALVGDAAHAVHPLAGQGVNIGLLDAAALLQCVERARQSGQAIGSLATLRRYERWRRAENALMIRALDAISRAFESNHPGFTFGRNVALWAANQVGPLNRHCMKVAMGLVGDLPNIARNRAPRLGSV